MEVVAGRYVAPRERGVEDRVAVEAAERVEGADLAEHRVVVDVPLPHPRAPGTSAGTVRERVREHRLADPGDRPHRVRAQVVPVEREELVDVGNAGDEDPCVRKCRGQRHHGGGELRRKTSTGVIALSLEAQTSFAPMRIVTYSAPRPITPCTWPARSAMSAPLAAWLNDRPVIDGLSARSRL